jgi:microcystin-dependent protein
VAGTITAALAGNATSATTAGNVTGVVQTANGGTGVNGTAIYPTTGTVITDSATQTLTGKTISGASNTVTNLADTALATNLTNASKFFTRDASGVPTSSAVAIPAGAIVGTSATQVLTNKDIDGATASATSRITLPGAAKSILDSLVRKAGTVLYGTDTQKAYIDNGTTLTAIGSGGNSERNYLSLTADGNNPVGTIQNGLTDTGSRSSAGQTWGASDTTKLTVVNNTTSPLRETGDFKLSHVAVGAAFIESTQFSIDSADAGKALVVSFDLTGNVLSGDYDVVAVRYNSSGIYQEKISIAGTASSGTPASALLPTGTTVFKGFFITSTSTTDLYAIRFRRLSGSATSNPQIDTLFVGPQSLGTGAIVTSFVDAVTPSSGWFVTGPTNATTTVKQARIGMEAHLKYAINATGISASFSELSINLPADLTVDATSINRTSTGRAPIGRFELTKPGVGNYTGVVYYEGSAFVCRYLTSTSTPGSVANNAPVNWDTTTAATSINIDITLPIAQWSSNVTMADRAVEEYVFNTSTSTTATDTTSFGYGISGAKIQAITAGLTRRVRFTSPILATDTIFVEVSTDQIKWQNLAGGWQAINAANISPITYQNGVYYGIGKLTIQNATDVDVFFGDYASATGATYGAAGAAWTTPGQGYWRCRKISGGASVGFPISARNIVGDTSPSGTMVDFAGTVAPAGWLMCDGSAVSRTVYASLFAVVGTSYGTGDGSTTFNLPDFRGRFARYNDNMGTPAGAAGRDSGRAHASSQTDAMQGHYHSLTNNTLVVRGSIGGGAAVGLFSNQSQTVGYTQEVQGPTTDGTNGTPRTAAETRPINLSCNRIIKY